MADEELSAEVAGQKLSFKTGSLNTVATIATLVLVCLLCYVVWVHTIDTKEASKELVSVMKENAQATREQTCIIGLPQDRREQNADLCKRLSR